MHNILKRFPSDLCSKQWLADVLYDPIIFGSQKKLLCVDIIPKADVFLACNIIKSKKESMLRNARRYFIAIAQYIKNTLYT